MIKNLGLPLCVGLAEMDELHLSNPNKVDGWNVTHLLSTKVCLVMLSIVSFINTSLENL